MYIIFLGLAFWNSLGFVVTLFLGETHRWPIHFTAAISTALVTCFTHSLALIHSIAAVKTIAAVAENQPPPNDQWAGHVARAKRVRASVLPWIMAAPVAVIVAVWLGAAHHTGRVSVLPHAVMAYLAFVVNLAAFAIESRAIRENSALIREINSRLTGANLE